MSLENVNIGFAITGAFPVFSRVIPKIKSLIKDEKANVFPIMSFNAYNLDTRFGTKDEYIKRIEKLTNKVIINTIQEAEALGTKNIIDIMIVAPATGNTIAKLACGVCDTPVAVAVKAHLRNNKPLVMGISTSDGLSTNAANIGLLLNRKNYYFVPFRQDNPITKPCSLVFDPEYIVNTIKQALDREQIQPILL